MTHRRNILFLVAVWAAIFFASLFAPPVLDDADATHAQAAQAMLRTHDFVTLHVDGVRYLEKAPLPYWIAAASMFTFGENTFAIHLPIALTVLLLAMLGYRWSARAWGSDAALYTALFTLTSAGVFLFTRVFIPDALLALLLAGSLYSFLRSQDAYGPRATFHAYAFWIALALAVLTKGLVAIVFILGTILIYAAITRSKPWTLNPKPSLIGPLLFLLIAAPWHILAGLRNTHGADGHGFFWFYFVNEHFLRFLGRRIPRDYNKLPALWYWTLHLIWLFPWSFFAPAVIANHFRRHPERSEGPLYFSRSTTTLLITFAPIVLVFFAFSTNQEYYTFPAYLPLLMLLAAALTHRPRWITASLAALIVIGLAISTLLAAGLYTARSLPYNPDIGSALAHRDVANYTLSMSHFFDLTGASFAALRLPATLAAIAFAVGPIVALTLWLRTRLLKPALLSLALTMAAVLIAAHIAFARFGPMLSSKAFADRIHQLEPTAQVAILGDQAFGSSLPFYLHRQVALVDGRSTSMLFGSTFPDAPHLFLTSAQYIAQWGHGPRHVLFVPAGVTPPALPNAITLSQQSGKLLLTDRPLSLNEAR